MKNKPLELFLTFAKIGVFTFGGGYAMIPLIQRETVETRGWISEEDILDVIAIAEATPGPIAINSATFIGRKVAGFRGALCATLGVIMPSFIIIALVSTVLKMFEQEQAVKYAFMGIRAGVLALILKALVNLFRKCPKGWFQYTVMIAAFAAAAFLKVSAILVIAACALLGILLVQIRRARQ